MDIKDLERLLKDVNGSYADFVSGVIHLMEDRATDKQTDELCKEIEKFPDITASEVILRAYEKVMPDIADKMKKSGVTVSNIRNNDTPLDKWRKENGYE